MAALLSADELPPGFQYPRQFLRMVERGLTDLEPWLLLEGEQLVNRHRGLQSRFPERSLVPFARRQDNDDVACWDLEQGGGPS